VGSVSTGLLLAVAVGLGSNAAGTGEGTTHRPVRGNSSVEEVRLQTGRDVYYVGESFAGLSLTAVERRTDEAGYVSLLYGDCQADDHSGCALPLEIQTWPSCARNLALYDGADPFAPTPERVLVRGVPAGILDEGRQVELQTGNSTIVIFGESRALVARAAASLRGVDNPARPGDPLRPPVAGAVEGELDCP